MFRRKFLAVSALSVTTALAGCSFAADAGTPTPSEPTQEVRVQFSNDSDRTLQFTAVAAPSGLDGVRIEYRDGSERTFPDADTVDALPAEVWDGAVTFHALAEDAARRTFRSTGGSGAGMTFEEMPLGTMVVSTVADPAVENSLQSLTVGTCGETDRSELRVTVDATGRVTALASCTDEATQ